MINSNMLFKNKSKIYYTSYVVDCLEYNISEESPVIITFENKKDTGFNLVISCSNVRFNRWFNYRKNYDKSTFEGDLIIDILFRIKDDLKANGITTFVYFQVENYPAKLTCFSL